MTIAQNVCYNRCALCVMVLVIHPPTQSALAVMEGALCVYNERNENMGESEKRIEVVQMQVKDIKTGFGNPRKISKKKKLELEKSLEDLGDFGIFLIDEEDNVIAGNQRLAILMEKDPETFVTCKRLIGYTEAELRAINIKDNTHSGEWDLDLLADWTADLNIDLGIETEKEKDPEEKGIKDMEPIRFEKYNYVVIACNNEIDYNELVRNLGIEGKKMKVAKKRSIKARAVWYHDIKAQIIPNS